LEAIPKSSQSSIGPHFPPLGPPPKLDQPQPTAGGPTDGTGGRNLAQSLRWQPVKSHRPSSSHPSRPFFFLTRRLPRIEPNRAADPRGKLPASSEQTLLRADQFPNRSSRLATFFFLSTRQHNPRFDPPTAALRLACESDLLVTSHSSKKPRNSPWKRPSVYVKMKVLGAIEAAPGKTTSRKNPHVATSAVLDEQGAPHRFTWRNHPINSATTATRSNGRHRMDDIHASRQRQGHARSRPKKSSKRSDARTHFVSVKNRPQDGRQKSAVYQVLHRKRDCCNAARSR